MLKPVTPGQQRTQSPVKTGALKAVVPAYRPPQIQQSQQPQVPQQSQQNQPSFLQKAGSFANEAAKGFVKPLARIGMELPGVKPYMQLRGGSVDLPWLGKTDTYEKGIQDAQGVKQTIGAVAEPIVDVASLLYGGGAAKGALTGRQLLGQSLKLGAGAGSAYGAVQGLKNNESLPQIGMDTLKGGAIGAGTAGILHGVLSGAGKLIGSKETPVLQPVQPRETPNIQLKKVVQGQVPPSSILEKSSYAPSTAQIEKNVNKIETPIQSGVSKAQQQIEEARRLMKNAPKNVSAEDAYVNGTKSKADYQNYIDEAQKLIDEKTTPIQIPKESQTYYRGEGGNNVAQGKALLAEGRHFATDSEYPKGFGTVSEHTLKPGAKVLDLGDSTYPEISKKLGIPEKQYISPKNLSAIAKEKGYDVLKYNGEYKSTGKPFTHTVELTDNSFIPKSPSPIQTEILSKKADSIVNPTEITGKERGHIAKIANSENVSVELGKRLRENPDSYIQTRHQEPLVREAQRTIFDNPNEAERIATQEISDRATIMSDELAKHYDTIATQAKNAGDQQGFEEAMQKAVDISMRGSKNLSETARALVAAKRIDMLSPNGIIDYVNKAVKSVGEKGLVISNEKYYNIIRQAEEVKGILDPKQKALATFDLIENIYSDIPKSAQNKLSEVLNLPRAMMATADLSAPLRQGLFTMARNPKTFAKNFGSMFKYAFSEDAYRNLKADILTSPNYNLYVKHKLPLTDVSAELTGREEQFMSSLADKIPGFGKLAKGSNRAYSGFLNKMRMDLFDDFVKTGKLEGINDPEFLESAARFVGSATGRGKMFDFFEPHASLLNTVFFSPRLMASRVNLINPRYYMKLHPVVRKEALKTLSAFVGTGMSVLALAKLNGADVSTDPRNADFGKIKIGNTRFDMWGGFQQYARFLGQFISGEKVSSTTGKVTSLTDGGYKEDTRGSITANFLQSKENPIMAFGTKLFTGKDGLDPVNIPAAVVDMFIPMIAQDAFDLQREYGVKGLAMAVPGAFGVGSQTYQDQIPMLTKTPSGGIGIKYRSQPNLGETILNAVTGKQLSDVPKEQWGPLAEERLAEQKRQVELTKAKSDVLLTGEPKYVGDTFIFLDNGVVKTKQIKVTPRTPIKKEVLNNFYTK